MTKAQLREELRWVTADPMGYVVDGLCARPESSLEIGRQVNVSASTIRSLRSGRHSGSLRVDVWSELVRWLTDHPTPE